MPPIPTVSNIESLLQTANDISSGESKQNIVQIIPSQGIIPPQGESKAESGDDKFRYSPTPGKVRDRISVELNNAGKLPDPKTKIQGLAPAEKKVLSWVQSNSDLINTFANKWGVDRKAVAGIIMWEALENPSKIQVWGVGKFHFTEPTKPFTESLAEQLEKRGYLPSQSLLDRPGNPTLY